MSGMTHLQAILLGAIQGLTEFLPVSSSGHLVLFQQLFGLHEPALIFDLCLHLATLFVVFVMYRHHIWDLIAAWFRPWGTARTHPSQPQPEYATARRRGLLLLLANIPTGLLGLTFETTFERIFAVPWAVGLALIATGTLLWCLKPFITRPGTADIGIGHAILLGCIQGLAITPGISRSGSTIGVALLCGIQREQAARFSFLMGIPAILGAVLLKSSQLSTLSAGQMSLLAVGMISALAVGSIALRVVVRLVQQGELWRFSFYCWLVGLTAILVSL
jgi:undecaprenyl-diphosphatase